MGLFGNRKPKPEESSVAAQPSPSTDPKRPPPDASNTDSTEPQKKTNQKADGKGGKNVTRQNSTYPLKDEGKGGVHSDEHSVQGETVRASMQKQPSKATIDAKRKDRRYKDEGSLKSAGKTPHVGQLENKPTEGSPVTDKSDKKGKSQKKALPPLSKAQSVAGELVPVAGAAGQDLKGAKSTRNTKGVDGEKNLSKLSPDEAKPVSQKETVKQPPPVMEDRKPQHQRPPPSSKSRRRDEHDYFSSDAETDNYELENRKRRQRLMDEREAERAHRRKRPVSALKSIKSPSRVLLARASIGGPDHAQAANALRVYYRGKLDMERRKYLSIEAEKKFLVGRVKEMEIDLAKAKSSTLKEARPHESKLVLDLRYQIKVQQLEIAKLKEAIHSMEKRIQDEAKSNEKLQHMIDNQKELGARHDSHKKAQLANIVKDRGELETKFRELQMELAKERKAKEWRGAANYQLDLERKEAYDISYKRDNGIEDDT
ncbi:hypothetical protein HDU93_008149 [Gonapodya sp. JEL0774]|nr:hypothetical protein HDU93_008149 [Gonapodya sp. JEL0774]